MNKPRLEGAYISLEGLLSLWHHKQVKSSKRDTLLSEDTVHSTFLKSTGITFSDVRLYSSGDEMRHIHWPVSARTGKLHAKLFDEEKDETIICIVEQSQRLFFGSYLRLKSVLAAELTSLIVCASEKRKSPFVGYFLENNGYDAFNQAFQTPLLFLNQLVEKNCQLDCEVNLGNMDTYFREYLMKLYHAYRGKSVILYIVLDYSTDLKLFEKEMALLAKYSTLILIQVYDPIEKEMLSKGYYQLSTLGESMTASVTSDSQKEMHQSLFQDQIVANQELCHRYGNIIYFLVSTTDDIYEIPFI